MATVNVMVRAAKVEGQDKGEVLLKGELNVTIPEIRNESEIPAGWTAMQKVNLLSYAGDLSVRSAVNGYVNKTVKALVTAGKPVPSLAELAEGAEAAAKQAWQDAGKSAQRKADPVKKAAALDKALGAFSQEDLLELAEMKATKTPDEVKAWLLSKLV